MRQETGDMGQAGDMGQETEDWRQKTEDRRQKTEARRLETGDSRWETVLWCHIRKIKQVNFTNFSKTLFDNQKYKLSEAAYPQSGAKNVAVFHSMKKLADSAVLADYIVNCCRVCWERSGKCGRLRKPLSINQMFVIEFLTFYSKVPILLNSMRLIYPFGAFFTYPG